MANTIPDGIYYPENTTDMELDTILATMASSIQNGIGKRLKHQEVAVGCKAALSAQTALTTTEKTIAVGVNSSNGNFAQGMTVTSGIITVQTAGMYLVSGSLGIQPASGTTSALKLYKNAVVIIGDEQLSNGTFYQASKGTAVINCVPGDTIRMSGRCAAGTVQTAADQELTHLSVVMVQALPL